MCVMKIKLNPKERLMLGAMLPREGSFSEMVRVKEFESKIAFTDKERKEFNPTPVLIGGKQMTDFRPEGMDSNDIKGFIEKSEVEFEMGDTVYDAVSKVLKDLEKEKKLSIDFIGIYTKMELDK